jgi:hypothetical protein
MRHAFLVPLLLAAALPAGTAVQGRDQCIRIVALEDGARIRLGFNVPLPDASAMGVGRPFSVWVDGTPLPEVAPDRPHVLAIDFDDPRFRETRSARLDAAALLDTLRADPEFEIGSDPAILLPIRDGARIAGEMERCVAAAPRVSGRPSDARCRHSVPLADGGFVRFDFFTPSGRRGRVGSPAAPSEWVGVEIDGSPIPPPGSRAATIVLARPAFVRSSRLFVALNPILAALRSGAAIELRGPRDNVLHELVFPARAQAARQAEHCMAADREAGLR